MASELPAEPSVVVTRLAGKADPPTIVVGFTTADTPGRERRYVIRLRSGVAVSLKLGNDAVFDALLKKYPRFFDSPSRSAALRRVVARLLRPASPRPASGCSSAISRSAAAGTAGSTARSGMAPAAAIPKEVLLRESERLGDLQTAAEAVVVKAKGVMDKGYEAHRLRPGDKGYEYDKQVDFGEPEDSNDWDD